MQSSLAVKFNIDEKESSESEESLPLHQVIISLKETSESAPNNVFRSLIKRETEDFQYCSGEEYTPQEESLQDSRRGSILGHFVSVTTLRFWERNTRSLVYTTALNFFLYLVFFSFFFLIKEVSHTTVWEFCVKDIEGNILSIYISLLLICVVGKFGAKRIARLVDRSGSLQYASAELMMECMFDVFYSVMFRFLFPVLANVWTFVMLKLLHCSGDIIQDVFRMSGTYFIWSSKFQETELFKLLRIPVDDSSREAWNTRMGVDATIRVIISVVVGLQKVTTDRFIFPKLFGWDISEDVENYNVASVIIEIVVYVGSIILLPRRHVTFIKPAEVLQTINESSSQYIIFVIICLQYTICYFGVPEEVIRT